MVPSSPRLRRLRTEIESSRFLESYYSPGQRQLSVVRYLGAVTTMMLVDYHLLVGYQWNHYWGLTQAIGMGLSFTVASLRLSPWHLFTTARLIYCP